ncbi:MAG TPA: ammonium transporter [Solirubrobacteraceae bacterium]|nr:ammonium transporter [Solirubrobacteraceae bacterium]
MRAHGCCAPAERQSNRRHFLTWLAYPHWLNPGDNSWQLAAATLVGLMSVPGLVVLYGGVMQKRWSVNSMMMSFLAFGLVLVAWVLWSYKMGFGTPWIDKHGGTKAFFHGFIGKPGSILGSGAEEGQASIPLVTSGPAFHFPMSTLAYFQFVFAAITPILLLGSVLGRFNFKAWIPFVLLWNTFVYAVNAFLIWGGGYFAANGSLDFSGGYVIHLAAGVSGFVAAAVVGPRLQRDREVDAPNNLLMVATGAGLLWLGWNGFNGGDPYYAGADSAAAVLNTNLATAVAMLVWVGWDLIYRDKPGIIGTVNGMITGLVGITPSAGFVNGYGAIIVGVVAATIVWMAIRYLSRVPPFRNVDDTLGVIYTHGIAGFVGGLMVGLLCCPNMVVDYGVAKGAVGDGGVVATATSGNLPGLAGVFYHGGWTLMKWQFFAALFIIVWDGAMTFILLKIVGLFIPLRVSDEELEAGDQAIHGHEVYPSDVPTLGQTGGAPWAPAPAGGRAG